MYYNNFILFETLLHLRKEYLLFLMSVLNLEVITSVIECLQGNARLGV